jgi:cyclopropane fatty-acyl-phospholipid synthase-like methyltransferase
MKPIPTKEENMNLYLKNFMQLGEALMNAGGNSFLILKKHDDFLRTLAANNIEVTAKYNYPEEAMPLKTTDGPNFRLTEEDWNSFGEYHFRQDINEWEEWMEKRAKADEELQKLIKEYPMWQKPLSIADPKQ